MNCFRVSPFLCFILVIACVVVFPEYVYGLKCFECDDCAAAAGTSKPCDADKYKNANLPEGGEMACTFEYGVDAKLRKRCVFIRNDPQTNSVSKYSHCYKSLIDINGDKEDCICFTDDCNSGKPANDPKPPTSETGKSTRMETSIMIVGIAGLVSIGRFLGSR